MSGAPGLEDWPLEVQEALMEHLLADDVVATRDGQSLVEYATRWREERDRAAAATEAGGAVLASRVLDLEVQREGGTVREYLVTLLEQFWLGNADQKFGWTGESDWRYDLYGPLLWEGLIPAWIPGRGIGYRLDRQHYPEDRTRANALIASAIRHLGGGA